MVRISVKKYGIGVPEYFPTLHFVKSLFADLTGSSDTFYHLDFRGIQLLTDEVFYALYQNRSNPAHKDVLDHVSEIILSGCIHITDQALKDIGRTFPLLQRIYLDGCGEITEKGLLSLGNSSVISVVGCNISVPVQIERCVINYQACPLLATAQEIKDAENGSDSKTTKKEASFTKVAILSKEDTTYSLSKFLAREPQDKLSDVSYRELSCPDDLHDVKGKKTSFSVFELHTRESYYSTVLSEKGVYVITLNLNKDIFQNLMIIMNSVKGLCTDPVFIIVMLYNNETTAEDTQYGADLADTLKERLEVQNQAIENYLEEENMNKVKITDFQAQQRFSRALKVKDKLKEISFYIYMLNKDTDMLGLQYPQGDDETEEKNLKLQGTYELVAQELTEKTQEWSSSWDLAVQSLTSLNKADVTELRSFASAPALVVDVMKAVLLAMNSKVRDNMKSMAKPPDVVLDVLGGVLLLFNIKNKNVWPEAKRLLSDPALISKMIGFGMESMSSAQVKRLAKHIDTVQLDPQKIMRVSRCCASFWNWVLAIYNYGVNILPLHTHYMALKSQLEKTSHEKDADQTNVAKVDTKERHQENLEEVTKLLQETEVTRNEKLRNWSKEWESSSVKNIKKSDISEIKNFKSPASAVQQVMEGVLILFHKKYTAEKAWEESKKLLGDQSFLKLLLEYDKDGMTTEVVKKLTKYIEDTKLTTDMVRKTSGAAAQIWTVVLSMQSYGVEVLPTVREKQKYEATLASLQKGQGQAPEPGFVEKGPGLLWKRLEKEVLTLQRKEPDLKPSSWGDAVDQVWSLLQALKAQKVKVCSWAKILEEMKSTALNDRVIAAVLRKLNHQGLILYYPSAPEPVVVLDLQAFSRYFNSLYSKENVEKPNENTTIALPYKTPIFNLKMLTSRVEQANLSENEVDLCLSVAKHLGLVLDVPHVVGEDNSAEGYMFSFSDLDTKASMRVETEQDEVSGSRFTRYFWPEGGSSKRLSTDVYVAYTLRLSYGLPPALLNQILAECIKLGQVIHMWLWGFVVRCGAVDIKIQHNVHAFNITSSIDLDARTTCITDDVDHRVTQDYLWSVANTYLLVIDYYINMYKAQVWHRIPCQGSCSTTDLPHFFSTSEMVKEVDYIPQCTLCGDQQMSKEIAGYVTGKRGILPFHDLTNADEKDLIVGESTPYGHIWNDGTLKYDPELLWVCYHCGMSKQAAMTLWKMQCSLYPVPDSIALKYQHKKGVSLYYAHNIPIYGIGLEGMHVTMLEDCKVQITISNEDYLTDGTVFQDKNYEKARVFYDLKTGEFSKIIQSKSRKKQRETLEQFEIGDRLSIEAYGSQVEQEDEDIADSKQTQQWTFVGIQIALKKNGTTFKTFAVPYRSHVGILVTKNGGDENSAKEDGKNTGLEDGVLLECPTYPYCRKENFPLGSAVLYKTGLGNQWAVGFVHNTENSKLILRQENGDLLEPDAEDTLPVGLYTDISIALGKDLLRTKEQMVQYLIANNCHPAPFGLFVHLYNEMAHSSNRMAHTLVHVRSHHVPKACTWYKNSPPVLEQLFNRYINSEGKSGKFSASMNHVFIPHDLSFSSLVHAPRQVLQDWQKINVHFVCKGPQWGMYNSHEKDYHFMTSECPFPEPPTVCTKVTGCKQKKPRKARPLPKDKKLNAIEEENEQENNEEDEEENKLNEADRKIHLHAGDHMEVVMAYYFMLRNTKNCLPSPVKRSMFSSKKENSDEELTDVEVSGLYRIMAMYKDVFMLYDRILETANYATPGFSPKANYRGYNRLLTTTYKKYRNQRKHSLMCQAHDFLAKKSNLANVNSEGEDPFQLQTVLAQFASCVGYLSIQGSGNVGKHFENFLKYLPNLKALALNKCNLKSIVGVSNCTMLTALDVADNHIEVIPDELMVFCDTMTVLNVSGNPIVKVPDFIVNMVKLRHLYLGNTLIRELPKDIGNLTDLRTFSLKVTMVNELPESISKWQMLRDLNLQGVPWLGQHEVFTVKSYDQFVKWAAKYHATKALPLKDIFDASDIRKNQSLDEEEFALLNEKLVNAFPRFGQNCDPDDEYGGIPKEVFSLRRLKSLAMGGQLIHSIPDAIENLKKLKGLFLFYSPNLQGVSSKVGTLRLNVLSIAGSPKCRTPPQEIIEKGMRVMLAYLKKLSQGSEACYRTKLMFVGLGGAGKTSLTRALMAQDHTAPVLSSEAITDGIDISTWAVKHGANTVQYSVWDFAGQTVYYNTHQFFLSNRALYLLVWNTRLGYEHSGLDFWLSSIACHCPKAPIFIVGTHADQITKPELPMDAMKQKHPNIAGFFVVSSVNGKGIKDLYDALLAVTLRQPYIGEMIPESWLACERSILYKRGTDSLLPWTEVESQAEKAGVYGEEIIQAVRFLHELGTLQHFENDMLKDQVVINPQWIVDVMACVVSVHNKVIVDGYLVHSDVSKIWSDYPVPLHDWLLRLTEVFDLTFPLSDKPVSVVPCLLPQAVPKYTWPSLDDFAGAKETKIVYTFDYLPAGLFNRAQVRLYQFSETSNMWKTGSILSKNNHHALIQQIGALKLLVKVFGLRPENILLMIHEVIEGLISDFFQGVKYEYQIPCPDCTMVRVEEPTLFTSKILRKAIEMKALFLQCHSLFHTLSIMDIQSTMPPQSGGDYEIQIENAVRDLEDLGGAIGTDLFLLYCEKDLPAAQSDKLVDIRKVKDDLQSNGFNCWFTDKLASLGIEQVAVAMKNARMVVVFVSDDFVLDEQCKRMFRFARESLRKDILLVMVGTGREWIKSDFIGIQVSDEVFVNLQRLHQYTDRFQELLNRITQKLGSINKPADNSFDVFLSYCWVNSESAVEQGHAKRREGCIGYGDPRELKKLLGDHGITCWIDNEQIGRTGLYEDIAVGMKHSKVVVAFISDEYALSTNCQIEFRFAHTSLRKPIILAVVGTGFLWESTEVGMLSLGYPKINFQVRNNMCHDQLLQYVQEALDGIEDQEDEGFASRPSSAASLSQKEMAFQELYEMAQRKFLRQVCSYLNNSDPYPRLMVADLNYDPDENEDLESVTQDELELTVEDDTFKPTFIIDDLRVGQFCIKTLCEYEGGWHCVHSGIPIDLAGKDLLTMWRLVSPYMARMLAILKHSNINLNIVRTAEGEKLIKNLEELLSTELHMDVEPVYLALRQFVINKDVNSERGNLKRCYAPSGKVLWLCEEHQQMPRVTVLDDPELSPDPVEESPENHLMFSLEREMNKKSEEDGDETEAVLLRPRSASVRSPKRKASKPPMKKALSTPNPLQQKPAKALTKQPAVQQDTTPQPAPRNKPTVDVQSQPVPTGSNQSEPVTSQIPPAVTPRQSTKRSVSEEVSSPPPPLSEREKTEIRKRVSRDNLVSMMSPAAEGTTSQACVIL